MRRIAGGVCGWGVTTALGHRFWRVWYDSHLDASLLSYRFERTCRGMEDA